MEMAIDEIGVDSDIKHKLMKNFMTVANQLVNVTEAST
jgi:truncated hemoglobin YjbI